MHSYLRGFVLVCGLVCHEYILLVFLQDRKTCVHCAEWSSGQARGQSSNKQVQRSVPFFFLLNWQRCQFAFFVVNMFFIFLVKSDLSVGLGSGKLHSLPLSSVYTWGSGITAPLRLPMLNTEVLQVSLGRTQKMGVTKSGRLITWEVSAECEDFVSIWCAGASFFP